MFREWDLESMGVPAEAWPLQDFPYRGTKSYTVCSRSGAVPLWKILAKSFHIWVTQLQMLCLFVCTLCPYLFWVLVVVQIYLLLLGKILRSWYIAMVYIPLLSGLMYSSRFKIPNSIFYLPQMFTSIAVQRI